MGLLQRIFGSKPRAASTPPPDDDFWYTSLLAGGSTASGQFVSPDSALRSIAVYACIKVLAETIAALPIHIYKKLQPKGKEIALTHPVYDLVHSQPNAWQTAFEFKEQLMTHVLLRGNAYAQLLPGRRGFADQLIPLQPDTVTITQSPANYELRYTVRRANGTTYDVPQTQMLHVRGMSLDGINGVSPITYHRETIGLSLGLKEYGAAFFGNSARPSGILEHPGRLTKEAQDRLKEGWRKYSRRGSGETAILEEGMKFHPVAVTNEDSQYLETQEFTTADIARLFRVPGVLIGLNDKTATYASAEQFFLSFAVHSIMPWCVRQEQALERDLIQVPEVYFIKYNMAGLLRGDLASRYAAYAVGRNGGWLTPNEIRALEDMNPRDDAGGDAFLDALNMQRSDQPRVDKQSPPSSALVDPYGHPLVSHRDLQQLAEHIDEPVPVDLNAYGRGVYANGHAHREEQR